MRLERSAIARRKPGSPTRSVSLCRYTYSRGEGPVSCAFRIAYPRADSPTAPFSSAFVPPLSASAPSARATNASQAAIARHGRAALQRPIAVNEGAAIRLVGPVAVLLPDVPSNLPFSPSPPCPRSERWSATTFWYTPYIYSV